MDYVLSLPFRHAMELVNKAQTEESTEYYYRWWLARYPLYTEKTYETFNEFHEKVNPPKVEYDSRTKDEIMAEILDIEVT